MSKLVNLDEQGILTFLDMLKVIFVMTVFSIGGLKFSHFYIVFKKWSKITDWRPLSVGTP